MYCAKSFKLKTLHNTCKPHNNTIILAKIESTVSLDLFSFSPTQQSAIISDTSRHLARQWLLMNKDKDVISSQCAKIMRIINNPSAIEGTSMGCESLPQTDTKVTQRKVT